MKSPSAAAGIGSGRECLTAKVEFKEAANLSLSIIKCICHFSDIYMWGEVGEGGGR